MNKRDMMLDLIHGETPLVYIPAAFFMHFDNAHHLGQAAIDKHLEFFRYTGMDFVKIQFEETLPAPSTIKKAGDWASAPYYQEQSFEEMIRVVKGLVKAARSEALVIMTLYSPFMWAAHMADAGLIDDHLMENPDAVKKGLTIMTENVLLFVRMCKHAGIDGFYASTQGGETFRDRQVFLKYIMPTDLVIWDEIKSCDFNILHVCDYEGGYDDLTPFINYPGEIVSSGLRLGDRNLTPEEASVFFGKPFMGGLERTGIIAKGSTEEISKATKDVLAHAPKRFVLAADCTVPSDTPWEHLKTAIDIAHKWKPG